jgi:peptidoglycan-associated lipoprotein
MKFSAQSKAIAMLFSVGLIAGCSSTGNPMEDADVGSDVSAVDQQGGSTVYSDGSRDGVSSAQLSDEERMAAQQQSQQMALRDVTVFYFDFDTAEINAESRDVLVAHARYLSANPSMNVRLEGHADDRGTSEYNLALGERRANAVQRFLIVNGASRGQLETISYGEEKPAVQGMSDSARAQNRRVELIFR